ncbi:hypothetical protein FKM82_020300 [Ascaphus truei]
MHCRALCQRRGIRRRVTPHHEFSDLSCKYISNAALSPFPLSVYVCKKVRGGGRGLLAFYTPFGAVFSIFCLVKNLQ